MGDFVKDGTTADLGYQLRRRFRGGGPLEEMAVIHKEFGLFSGNFSLKQAFRILNIVPHDFDERRRWFVYLDSLKRYPSDQDGVNGHDRIVKAYKENLESASPLPVYTTIHRAADDNRVTVNVGKPVAFEDQQYLVMSIPTTPTAAKA